MRNMIRTHYIVIAAGFLCTLAHGDEPPSGREKDAKSKLQQVQWLIGEWKGVGQPRRGSSRGAWTERSQWAWIFDETPGFSFESVKSKYYQGGELRAGKGAGEYKLIVKGADSDEPISFEGALGDDGRLVLGRSRAVDGQPARISIRKAAEGDRLLVLYEKRFGSRFQRLAEVGYTRQGSGFGRGTSFVECVVTGGLGTIAVTHQGKTYYVCCTGCRDYFNDDPAGVLEEYRQKKAEEAAKKD